MRGAATEAFASGTERELTGSAVEMCSGDVGDVVREEAARPSPCEWRASVDECGLKYTCEMVSIIRESGRRRFVFSTVSFEAPLNNLQLRKWGEIPRCLTVD